MFRIYRMGCDCRHDSDFRFERPDGIDSYLMLFVKTRAFFMIGGERVVTDPGTFIIYGKDQPICYGAAETEYVNDWMRFDCVDIPGVKELYNKPLHQDGSVDVSRYFHLIADCYYHRNNPKTEELLVRALLGEVLADSREPEENIAHYRELIELRRRIYAAPGENWTIEKMSRSINISESYLFKLYKRAFGVTCTADVINSRIEQAGHYLSYSDMGIEEIAFRCGYTSVTHFSRQFRQILGITPTEYRKTRNTVSQ